ncbi:MAG: transporter [Rhodospirillales bacterium]|nr:transporter [Rhodospirillales bacterium]
MLDGHAAEDAQILSVIDRAPISPLQFRVFAIGALASVLDGLDIQIVAFVLPSLVREWHLGSGQLAWVIAAGLVGMGVGASVGGALGDRLGRKPVLIASVALFAAFTLAATFADDVTQLTMLRLATGLGLGAAFPNITALAAEYAPDRARSVVVAVLMCCTPLGGVLGALLSAAVLDQIGWRGMFAIGGAVPLLSVLLMFALPESIGFLARAGRHGQAEALLARVAGRTVRLAAIGEARDKQRSLDQVLTRSLRRDTLAFWACCFASLYCVYSFFSWTPTILQGAGLSPREAALGTMLFNLGGVIGALLSAALCRRFGSRLVLRAVAAIGVGAGLVLAIKSIAGGGIVTTAGGLVFLGAAVNATQVGLFVLGAYLYPTACRAAGIGFGLGVGRVGAILSAIGGGQLVMAAGGAAAYFLISAAFLAVIVIALGMVRRHVPPLMPRAAPATG